MRSGTSRWRGWRRSDSGIICTTVIGTVVFPRALGPSLSRRILAWVANASTWTDKVLAGDKDTANAAPDIGLAADAVELRLLASQLAYDTSKFQAATRWIGELQRRMVLLLPLLASIGDRLVALRAANGITPAGKLLADLRVWVRAGAPPPRSEAERMRAAIARLEAEIDPRAGWNEVMRGSLLLRLRELVDVRQDMRDLRRHIEAGGGPLTTPLVVQTRGMELLHRDHGLALLSGARRRAHDRLALRVLDQHRLGGRRRRGRFAAVACCLFAALDDPTPALKKFLAGAVLSALAVGIGLFGILPLVHDFEILTLVLAAFFVPVGAADRHARHPAARHGAGLHHRHAAQPAKHLRGQFRVRSPTAASRPCWASPAPR